MILDIKVWKTICGQIFFWSEMVVGFWLPHDDLYAQSLICGIRIWLILTDCSLPIKETTFHRKQHVRGFWHFKSWLMDFSDTYYI